MLKISRISLFLVIFAATFALGAAARAAVFDPNNIISDAEILDSSAMSLQDIDAFLKSKGGYIAYNKFPNYAGVMKSAAEIIYDAANNFDCDGVDLPANASRSDKLLRCKQVTINPKFLLVLLQKEMSLIEEKNPTQRQLDYACGYGCPDGGGCNDRWRGFGKQVNSAALQFFDYMENPHYYTYRAGGTYTVSNTGRPALVIRPANQATAALYNYTPHVYNGNFNFFKLWLRFFTRMYPNNTLLQAKGEPGVWLIQDGVRRAFQSRGALTSRFDPKKILQVSKADLEKYPAGNPIAFPQYSLVRSPRGTVFLIVDDTRRGFNSAEALRKVGVNPEEIVNASWDDLNYYTEGRPITATSTYLTGALLQDKSTGGIWYVFDGTKAPLWDKVLLQTKFRGRAVIAESPEKLSSYATVEPAIFGDGELIKTDGNPGVFVIDQGQRRPFVSGDVFLKLGYKWANIIAVPKKIFDLYPEGEAIKEVFTEADITVVDPNAPVSTTTPEAEEGEAGDAEATETDAEATETVEPAPTTTPFIDPVISKEISEILNP